MSSEYKKKLDIPISSTNVPTIQMTECSLKLSFLNWENENIELEFSSTLAFRWHNLPCSDGLADDAAYEVLNSQWIKDWVLSNDTKPWEHTSMHHYQFCIHGCCVFEVISASFGFTKEEPEGVAPVSWKDCVF